MSNNSDGMKAGKLFENAHRKIMALYREIGPGPKFDREASKIAGQALRIDKFRRGWNVLTKIISRWIGWK